MDKRARLFLFYDAKALADVIREVETLPLNTLLTLSYHGFIVGFGSGGTKGGANYI